MLRLKNNLAAILLMYYNILDLLEGPPANRVGLLKSIIDIYQPNHLMFCGLQSEESTRGVLNTPLRTNIFKHMRADIVS